MVKYTFPSYQLQRKESTKDRIPPWTILSFCLDLKRRKPTPFPLVRHKSIANKEKYVLAIEFQTLINSTK
jgi:hypothetical protein